MVNKLFALAFVLVVSSPVLADVLNPGETLENLIQEVKENARKCPPDKPLFDGDNCFSCDEPKNVFSRYAKYIDCEVCPNRKIIYECWAGPVCALIASPEPPKPVTSAELQSVLKHDPELAQRFDQSPESVQVYKAPAYVECEGWVGERFMVQFKKTANNSDGGKR